MARVQKLHPELAVLKAFLTGRLSEKDASKVEDHINGCESCCQKLSTIPDDRITRLAREASLQDEARGETRQIDSGETNPQELVDDQIEEKLAQLSRYRIFEKIGSGGMGDVYRAEHKLMGRSVALKVIRASLTSNPHAVSRFRNEVRAAARFTHPNIVSSFDAEHANGLHFLVMELVEGESLEKRVKKNGPVSVSEAIEIIRQTSLGLDAAYNNGMVHRDIKPHNLMIDKEDQIKILDFGLARFEREHLATSNQSVQAAAGLTGTNFAIGTPDYIAPEQAKDASAADIRSDIYSLGCTLFFLLTGRPPFPKGDAIEKISQHMVNPIPEIEKIRPDVPNSVIRILKRMTQKDPKERYQLPSDLIGDLDRADLSKPTIKASASDTRRSWIIGSAITAVALAMLFAFSFLLAPRNPQVLFVVPNRLYYPDLFNVKAELEKSNIPFKTAAITTTVYPVASDQGESFEADMLLADVNPNQFQAIVFLGGENEPFQSGGSHSQEVEQIANSIHKRGGVVAAICGGVSVLQKSNLNSLIQDGQYEEQVFTGDRVVTAPDPDLASPFVKELLRLLGIP